MSLRSDPAPPSPLSEQEILEVDLLDPDSHAVFGLIYFSSWQY